VPAKFRQLPPRLPCVGPKGQLSRILPARHVYDASVSPTLFRQSAVGGCAAPLVAHPDLQVDCKIVEMPNVKVATFGWGRGSGKVPFVLNDHVHAWKIM